MEQEMLRAAHRDTHEPHRDSYSGFFTRRIS